MPFSRHARITVTNETEAEAVYYYVDYETYDTLEEEATLGRFRAQWRARIRPWSPNRTAGLTVEVL